MSNYINYIMEQAANIISIDSPSGFTNNVINYLIQEYEKMGYQPVKTNKGGLLIDLGGSQDGLLLNSHVDTLGAMAAEIKDTGAIRIVPVGGICPNSIETENCRIYTYDGKVYTGTIQLENASLHVNRRQDELLRTFDNLELLLDEVVTSKEDVRKLGIMTGNYICFDPRFVVTPSGYIKSRFLDDKLDTALLLGYAKYLKEENIQLQRKVYHHITIFEEVGHGGAASVPEDVTEVLSLDMGCVGKGLECTERKVSICVKDSFGPYHYKMVKELVQTAQEHNIDFATDIYPAYSSDADVALKAGYDVRHGLIGPGVYASHGYERSHIDGVRNTFNLLKYYIK